MVGSRGWQGSRVVAHCTQGGRVAGWQGGRVRVRATPRCVYVAQTHRAEATDEAYTTIPALPELGLVVDLHTRRPQLLADRVREGEIPLLPCLDVGGVGRRGRLGEGRRARGLKDWNGLCLPSAVGCRWWVGLASASGQNEPSK